MLQAGWDVQLLLPEGDYSSIEGCQISTFKPGLRSVRKYCKAVRDMSSHVDAVLLLENNPNWAWASDWSTKPENTFCLFYTPLQSLQVFKELGICRQSLLHYLAKNPIQSKLSDWSQRRCIVATEYQAGQLRKLGARDIHLLSACSISREDSIPARGDARKQLGWDDKPVVGYLGHFSRAKGVDVLIESFTKYDGPAVLALADSGKGKLKPASKKMLSELVQVGRVRKLGIVYPPTFLAACDVVALTYPSSSVYHLPQVMLEAFASSTAVITTDVGGLAELVQPGRTGLVVPPGDSNALADAIKNLVSDLPGTHELGRNARREFEDNHSREGLIEAIPKLMRN